nr:tRNA 2-thiouridine(34) synthase MnmA [Clostridia bacterium]
KEPMYVIRKDVPENRVVLGRNEDLFQRELTAAGVNWVSLACPDGPVRTEVKIRYSQAAYPATVTPLAEDRVRICFDEPQRAATRGQAAVFYDGDLVLGGGTIE